MRAWLLPEYIEDILPAEAARIERLRRAVLDLFAVHGYELVMPPLLEYVESLSLARDQLYLQTFKLLDHLSGRTLGLRAASRRRWRYRRHLLIVPRYALCYSCSSCTLAHDEPTRVRCDRRRAIRPPGSKRCGIQRS